MAKNAIFNIGDELFFYDDKTGDVEKVLVKDIRYPDTSYKNDIIYFIERIDKQKSSAMEIVEERLVHIASKSKAGLLDHIISRLEDKVEAWDKTIKSCQKEIQEVKGIQRNIKNTITKLKQER